MIYFSCLYLLLASPLPVHDVDLLHSDVEGVLADIHQRQGAKPTVVQIKSYVSVINRITSYQKKINTRRQLCLQDSIVKAVNFHLSKLEVDGVRGENDKLKACQSYLSEKKAFSSKKLYITGDRMESVVRRMNSGDRSDIVGAILDYHQCLLGMDNLSIELSKYYSQLVTTNIISTLRNGIPDKIKNNVIAKNAAERETLDLYYKLNELYSYAHKNDLNPLRGLLVKGESKARRVTDDESIEIQNFLKKMLNQIEKKNFETVAFDFFRPIEGVSGNKRVQIIKNIRNSAASIQGFIKKVSHRKNWIYSDVGTYLLIDFKLKNNIISHGIFVELLPDMNAKNKYYFSIKARLEYDKIKGIEVEL